VTTIHTAALSVACPTCGALSGQACVVTGFAVTDALHVFRVKAAATATRQANKAERSARVSAAKNKEVP